MRQIISILIISVFMTSCATVVTRKSYTMNVNTNAKNAKVEILDNTYQLPATVKVERSKNNLDIKLITDITTFDYTVKSSINPAFLFGNLLFMQVSPAAYLIDLTSQKRFYYGKSVFLNISDSIKVIRPPISKSFHNYFSKTYPTDKDELYLHLSFPHINSFYFKPENEKTKINTGFWGLAVGFDYFYSANKFVNFGVSGVMDFFIPFPAAVDFSGERESMSSIYTSLSNNHKLGRFSIGYGLSFAKNAWNLVYHDRFDPPPPTRDPVTKSHNAFGLIFPTYFQSGKYFNVGIIYRPTFYRQNITDKFSYEHLISMDFAWKIRIKKEHNALTANWRLNFVELAGSVGATAAVAPQKRQCENER